MLRKFLTALILVFGVLCAGMVYLKLTEAEPQTNLMDRNQGFEPTKNKIIPALVREVNEHNAKIHSLSCDDVDIKIWHNGYRSKLGGQLYYQKPRNFRLEITSLFGKEVDLGSNDKAFWYWSNRDKRPGLYWAAHEDYDKTRLKTPFNPLFMKASLGLEMPNPEQAHIAENAKDIMLSWPQKNSMGQPILFSIFINKEKRAIDGVLVTDNKGKALAACEIQEHSGGLPNRLLYTWYEEDRIMSIKLNKPSANVNINPNKWVMPEYKPKINMADE